MYQNAGVAGTSMATGGMLAITGANTVWVVLSGFAMVALGAAILRIIPKSNKK